MSESNKNHNLKIFFIKLISISLAIVFVINILFNLIVADKFKSFGCETVEIDGHDIKKIYKSLINKNLNKPKVIVANTIKGKGIKLFENDNNWHHSIITKSIYKNILKEL